MLTSVLQPLSKAIIHISCIFDCLSHHPSLNLSLPSHSVCFIKFLSLLTQVTCSKHQCYAVLATATCACPDILTLTISFLMPKPNQQCRSQNRMVTKQRQYSSLQWCLTCYMFYEFLLLSEISGKYNCWEREMMGKECQVKHCKVLKYTKKPININYLWIFTSLPWDWMYWYKLGEYEPIATN